ncbi:MAG: alanine dehydrogenase [Flavobacteriales bacterium]|nr:alanine dehydrogenase [Flavobacteriales bacterium]
MKLGIIREGKTPPDKRVPFTPEQCNLIEARYPQVDVLVQKSEVRAFTDEEYEIEGLSLVYNLQEADVIFGVKEVELADLIPNKTFFFFSHTIKKQPYNRELLRRVLELNIKLVDYECLTEAKGGRILGFGRFAGIVGAYNAFLTYGKRSGRFELKAAHQCKDQKEMESELSKVSLPPSFKIAISGFGRVAGGAREILEKLDLNEVDPDTFLSGEINEPTFTQLSVVDYFKKPSGESFERKEAFDHADRFESDFFKFAKVTDIFIPCHYWDDKGPGFITAEELAHPDFNIQVVADISCDIDDPIASTIRPSTIESPIYDVDKKSRKEVDGPSDDTVSVMAVDNLPCELPREASADFGEALLDKVLPQLFGSDNDRVIDRATIAEGGKLKPDFEYLQDYVDGEE